MMRYEPGEVESMNMNSLRSDIERIENKLKVEHRAALAAKDARIAELEAERTEWVEAYWKTHHQSGHIKRSNHRGDSYAHQPAEPATHSEDGGEVVGYRVPVSGVYQFFRTEAEAQSERDEYESTLGPEDIDSVVEPEPLMTVAQHERIVAAKDAEIAQLREARDRYCELWNRAANQTAPQPARQVGGDEQRAFNYSVLHDFANKHGLDYNELCTTARAALAPVASQVGGDDDHLHGHPRYEHDSRDEIELFLRDAYAAGANAAHSRSLTTALDYAARHAPKLRAALAPAAVVMPDRRAEDYPSPRTRDAWNDALDAVARLNRRAIPEGLLERIAKIPLGSQGLLDHASAMDELRALLSKEEE